MKIKELFQDGEIVTLEKYLNYYHISDVDSYLKPNGKYIENPMLYDNMIDAIQMFKYHYTQNDKAYILCDSGDTDGVMSTTIIYQFMRQLNPKWNIKILIHTGKQRGLQDDELFNEIKSNPRPFLIIPDSGTNDKDRAKELSDIGINILILDHHNLTTPIENGVLINNQVGNVDKYGSGCVVTHKFIQAMSNEMNVKYANDYIDMVALSIISDGMMVYSMQNREYLYYGLFKSRKMIHNKFLSMMFDKFIGEEKEYDQHKISFVIVPKINACCRSDNQTLKQNMIMAFIGVDEDKLKTTYEDILNQMADLHKAQRDYVTKYIDENKDIIDSSNDIVIHSDSEIIRSNSGLLAGKLKEIYDNKPVIIGKDFNGIMIGSLRSDIPLQEILNDSEYVEWASGHSKQCGIKMMTKNIPQLVNYINSLNLDYTDCKDVIQSYAVNSIPKQIYGLYDGLNALWSGNTLPMPLYHIYGIKIRNTDIKILGAKGALIKFNCNGVDFIKLDNTRKLKEDLKLRKYDGDNYEDITTVEWLEIEVIGFPTINEYRGYKNKQIEIQDIEISKPKEKTFEDIFGF